MGHIRLRDNVSVSTMSCRRTLRDPVQTLYSLAHIVSEGSELLEHDCCPHLSRLKNKFLGNVVVAVDDADCSTDLPGPDEKLADGGSDFLNLGRQQDISHVLGATQQKSFT